MTDIDTTDTNYEDQLFGAGDFVFTTRTGGDGNTEILGGGYKVNSMFLQGGIPPMTTFNTNDQTQTGGKVSSPFESLAVPAGLFYVNMRVPKKDTDKSEHYYKQHEVLSDDMVDKLFGLVEADKKRKRKTRKQTNKLHKNKTRRHK